MKEEKVFFGDTLKAFASRNDKELKHLLWLFKLMGNPSLVKLLSRLAVFSIKAGLPVSAPIKATIFRQFCGGESIEESVPVVKKLGSRKVGSILDYSVEGKEREEDFERTKDEVIKIIHLAKNNPAIPYTSLKLTGIAPFSLLEKISAHAELSEAEDTAFSKLKHRLADVCYNAYVNNVPVYFDAEESWIQPAIDRLAEEMMAEYNQKKSIVLTTLQMYRRDRLSYLKELIVKGREKKFFVGIKLVRGAYWEKENERSARMGLPSPVHERKEDTDRDFNEALDTCLRNIDLITLCAGTHNEASTMHLLDKMKEMGIANDHPHVYFSQLYGMSDHITFNLADAGYNVTKYLPYGPVKSVVPYLIRRAEENTAIAGQMGRELSLILAEKKRRQHEKLLPPGVA